MKISTPGMIKGCLTVLAFTTGFYWQRALAPESTVTPILPINVQVFGEHRSVRVTWYEQQWHHADGYIVRYRPADEICADSLIVFRDQFCRILDLKDDTKYFISVRAFNKMGKSPYTPEIAARTYYAFEDFSQHNGPLDPRKWYPENGYITPVRNNQVDAAEIQQYLSKIKRSYGQYQLANPKDDVVIECQFRIGYPNVGGAGVIIRSEKAINSKYYHGYTAYVFWTGNQWELRLEESARDCDPMRSPRPVLMHRLAADSWIKVCLQKQGKQLTARVYDLMNYTLLAEISHEDRGEGNRPGIKDTYCGFYTCQYGGNTIFADNFGLRRVF